MERLARWLVFMTMLHCTLAGTISSLSIYLLDKTGNPNTPLNEMGGQPAGVRFNMTLNGDDYQAEDTIQISSNLAVFKVPAAPYSVLIATVGGSGKSCLLTYTTGTAYRANFVLKPNNGQCLLPRSNKFSFTLPQAAVAPNPTEFPTTYKQATWTVYATGDSESQTITYADGAIIYVTVDPRTADDSDSYLFGGGTPGGMRIGFTPTADLVAEDQITIQADSQIFRRGTAGAYTITIGSTGCSAVPQPGNGQTGSLVYKLQGSSCKLAANMEVDPSSFRIPSQAMGPLPVNSVVSVTVTASTADGDLGNANLNPAKFSTNNGCGSWGAWAACSATCEGTTSRSRSSTGVCSSLTQTRSCNSMACACTAWGPWSACSATCKGSVSRTRTGSSRSTCNVAIQESLPCGPQDCNCPWTQSACSSSCGSGVRTRTLTTSRSSCGPSSYQVVCNESWTSEARACPCLDVNVSGNAWKDSRGKSCADYASNNYCTTDGGVGRGWSNSWGSFASVARDGLTATAACCACGKDKCVKDTVLLIDQSASIADADWVMIKQYITDRVAQTPFTNEYGNRIGVVGFEVTAKILCPMTWDQNILKTCVAGIQFAKGGGTATADGLNLAGAMLGNFSRDSRTRVIEMLTDGSPNRPTNENIAIPLAYNAAWRLKDQGITILTLGMGTACTPAKPNDCLNREVLDTMASEPTSSFAVLLDNYESLAALSLFISSQCKPVVSGFEPSPMPDPRAECKAKEDQIPDDYIMQNINCDKPAAAGLLQQYQCVEVKAGCGSYKCNVHVPPSVVQQLDVGCDSDL